MKRKISIPVLALIVSIVVALFGPGLFWQVFGEKEKPLIKQKVNTQEGSSKDLGDIKKEYEGEKKTISKKGGNTLLF